MDSTSVTARGGRLAARSGRRALAMLALVQTLVLAQAAAPVHAATPAETHGLVGVRAAHAAAAKPLLSLAEATAVHSEGTAEGAKITFDLTHGVETTAFVLADPDRVIIDLPQVDFSLGADAGKAAPVRTRRAGKAASLVASFRFGLLSPGRSRIVVDLQAPARIVRASMEKNGLSYRLVVELAKTDRASFRLASQSRTKQAASAIAPDTATQGVPVADAPTIVIDPGHGGPDTGAIVNGVVEKNVALAFAQNLAGKLEATGRFKVVMTRSTDVFIPLSERVQVARTAKAALMISVHADTLTEGGEVSGATVYTVSDKASDAAAAKVADKENESDAAMGVDGQADAVDVSDILFDLTRQETRAYSHVFARTLVNYWKVAGRLNKNPQRAAGFRVLKAPDVPSVLLELGYLSNPADAASLTSEEWRDRAAARMSEAVVAYFADRHGPEKAMAGVTMPDVAARAPGSLLQASAAGIAASR